MRDRPTAPDLLDTAAQEFRETILPALPRHLKYQALMVLNAMGIASRQAAAGAAPLEEARDRLRTLYAAPDGDLPFLEQRLAQDIRAGRFDPGKPDHAAAFDHLVKTTRAKAAESCPKVLERGPGA